MILEGTKPTKWPCYRSINIFEFWAMYTYRFPSTMFSIHAFTGLNKSNNSLLSPLWGFSSWRLPVEEELGPWFQNTQRLSSRNSWGSLSCGVGQIWAYNWTWPVIGCEILDKSFTIPSVSCFLSKKGIMIVIFMFSEGIKWDSTC